MIQEGNIKLFKQILAKEEGLNDFITSKDLYNNTSLHYIALFDDEEFIINILEHIERSQTFAFKLKAISCAQNNEARTPMDFFNRGKSDSYIYLHDSLQDLQVGCTLSRGELSVIVSRLQNTQKMRKSSSLARIPSDSNLFTKKKSSLALSSSATSLHSA